MFEFRAGRGRLKKKNIDARKVFLMPVHTPLDDFAGQNQKLCEGCTFLAPLSNYVFQNRNQYFNVAPRKVRGRFAEHFRAMGQMVVAVRWCNQGIKCCKKQWILKIFVIWRPGAGQSHGMKRL